VTPSLLTHPVTALLLDIEGTTTPIDFVYQTLFPYARVQARDYLTANLKSAQSDIRALLDENAEDTRQGLAPPPFEGPPGQVSIDSVVAYIHWLMDLDRKSTPLKSVQGKIWEQGYRRGNLRSQVFDDVPRAFKRWRQQGRMIVIYSSGSVLAQKLLFAHTEAGDLTPFISEFFDTNVGAKEDPDSYRRIADALELRRSEIVFVSDVTAELDAAAVAGLQTRLCLRPGNPPTASGGSHTQIRTFDEIV
jgi:enolase-phosphatase E1